MQYFDEKIERKRQTLDMFLHQGETWDTVGGFLGCEHEWVLCVHEGVNSVGSSSKCWRRSPYLVYSHEICTKFYCWADRFPEGWFHKITLELERRRDVEEKREMIAGQTT